VRTKSIWIGEVKEGAWVKVTGNVAALGPLMASQVSGRECIGFWCEVDDTVRELNGVLRKEDCGVFSIADKTGQVIVDGPFIFAPEIATEWSLDPDEHQDFLEEIGAPTDIRAAKVREELLQPGDRISVIGLAFLEPDPTSASAGFRAAPLVLHLRGSDGRPVILGAAGAGARLE